MKVKDLLEQEIDIDVVDDVCEELDIAFVGPLRLTKAGLMKFSDVLEYPVRLRNDVCIVKIDDESEMVWTRRLDKAIEFFHAAAGYCSEDDYNRWFE